jgi:hypothetical protein
MRYQALRSDIAVKLSSMMTSGTGSGDGKEVSTEGKRSLSFDMSIEKDSGGGFGCAGTGPVGVSSSVEVSVTCGRSFRTSDSGSCVSFWGVS